MNTPKTHGLYTSEYFREVSALASNTRESLVMACTPHEWLALFDAYKACGWDLTPDRWTLEQRLAAIEHGIVPAWDDDERPLPLKRCAGFYIDANTGELTSCKACNPNHDKPVLAPAWAAFHSGEIDELGDCWRLTQNDADVLQVVRAVDHYLDTDAHLYPIAAENLSRIVKAAVSVRRWVP